MRALLLGTLAYLVAWSATGVWGVPLARRVANNGYGDILEWKAFAPAPFLVRAEFRYDNPAIAGAGTGHFVWLPTWCRIVDYAPDVWGCKFL